MRTKRNLITLIAVMAITGLMAAVASAAGSLSPADSEPAAQVHANTDIASLGDAYDALSKGEYAFQEAMNANHALRKGKVAGVDLTADQKRAIQDSWLAGLYNARERYLDALAVLDVSTAQINAWELTHPQPKPCYSQTGYNCPTPVPAPTATAIPPTPTP